MNCTGRDIHRAFNKRLLAEFLIGKLEGSDRLENINMDKSASKWALMTNSERVVNYVLLAWNRVQLQSVANRVMNQRDPQKCMKFFVQLLKKDSVPWKR